MTTQRKQATSMPFKPSMPLLRLGLAALLGVLAGCSTSTASDGPPRGPASVSGSAVATTGLHAGSGVRLPPPAGRFSYQLGGAYPPPAGVTIVDRDRSEPPVPGIYSVCYINAFQAQPDAIAWWRQHHPDLLLHDRRGALVVDREWGEPLLDISTAARRAALLVVEGGWVDRCAHDGYQAVEADNLDSYSRSQHLLATADALAYARLLTARAHHDRLAIAQKNVAELSAAARGAGFDFAVAEECQIYAECDSYTAVYGREVIEIEYTDQPATAFGQACRQRGRRISVTRRDRDLLPAGSTGHVEQWCPPA